MRDVVVDALMRRDVDVVFVKSIVGAEMMFFQTLPEITALTENRQVETDRLQNRKERSKISHDVCFSQ